MIAYTSVSAKPDEPYPPNCETLSLAFPCPGTPGSSHLTDWEKYSKNPILPSAPSDKVIAWRDPYAREWETLDRVLGKEPGEVFYGIIAGGYKGIGPALFLYEIDKQKVENWTYLGDFGSKSSCWGGKPVDRWGADMRDIFEVANFVTLSATVKSADASNTTREEKRDFFLMSAATWASEDSTKFTPPQRPPRQEIFVSGDFAECSKETVSFRPKVTGYIDRGGYYAMNTLYDPTRAAVVAHAWVMEDDLSHDKRHEQGWSGFIALPRTIKLKAISDVLGCLGDELEDISSIELLPGATKDTQTVLALHVAPCQDVIDTLKDRAEQRQSWDGVAIENTNEISSRRSIALGTVPSHTAILQMKFQVKEDERDPIVIHLRHNEDLSFHTSILFDTASGTITVDRSKSVSSEEAQHCDTRPEIVPHVLFYCQDANGKSVLETLDVTVILDHGVIEVFANGRTAITTRIYTGHEEGCDHVSLEVGQHGVNSVELWHGLSCTLDYV
jgi:beta-fructofuranosidase